MTLSYEEYRERQREISQKLMQRLYRERRDEALEAYGRKCVICGNDDRTILMVVPKKGYRWTQTARIAPVSGGHPKYRWLQQNDYPDTFTLVCGPKPFSPCQRALQLLD